MFYWLGGILQNIFISASKPKDKAPLLTLRNYWNQFNRAKHNLRANQWFPQIGLFEVQAISLGPCRRPTEFLTSPQPCGRLSEIPYFKIHKVEKWKFEAPIEKKVFYAWSQKLIGLLYNDDLDHKKSNFGKLLGTLRLWVVADAWLCYNLWSIWIT
jgi:hypothetical protein